MSSMELLVVALRTPDPRARLRALMDLHAALEQGRLLEVVDLSALLDAVCSAARDANAHLVALALDCLLVCVENLGGEVAPFLPSLLPSVVACLGSSRTAVRDAAVDVLVSAAVVAGPAALLPPRASGDDDPLGSAARHASPLVREGVAVWIARVATELAPQAAAALAARAVAVAAPLLGDAAQSVREAATAALAALAHVPDERGAPLGADLFADLARRGASSVAVAAVRAAAAAPTQPAPAAAATPAPAAPVRAAWEAQGIGAPAGSPAPSLLHDQWASPLWRPGVLGLRGLVGRVAPARVFGVRDVVAALESATAALASPVTSADWKPRAAALERLRALVAAGVAWDGALGPAFVAGVTGSHALRDGLLNQLSDLRSSVVKDTCLTLAELSAALGPAFEPLAPSVVAALLRGVVVTKEVMSSACHDAIRTVLHNAHAGFPAVLPKLTAAATSRHRETRRCATGYLALALRVWSASVLARAADDIGAVLGGLLTDADAAVRAVARRATLSFRVLFPSHAESMLATLDASVAALVDEGSTEALAEAAAALREPVTPLTASARTADGGAPSAGAAASGGGRAALSSSGGPGLVRHATAAGRLLSSSRTPTHTATPTATARGRFDADDDGAADHDEAGDGTGADGDDDRASDEGDDADPVLAATFARTSGGAPPASAGGLRHVASAAPAALVTHAQALPPRYPSGMDGRPPAGRAPSAPLAVARALASVGGRAASATAGESPEGRAASVATSSGGESPVLPYDDGPKSALAAVALTQGPALARPAAPVAVAAGAAGRTAAGAGLAREPQPAPTPALGPSRLPAAPSDVLSEALAALQAPVRDGRAHRDALRAVVRAVTEAPSLGISTGRRVVELALALVPLVCEANEALAADAVDALAVVVRAPGAAAALRAAAGAPPPEVAVAAPAPPPPDVLRELLAPLLVVASRDVVARDLADRGGPVRPPVAASVLWSVLDMIAAALPTSVRTTSLLYFGAAADATSVAALTLLARDLDAAPAVASDVVAWWHGANDAGDSAAPGASARVASLQRAGRALRVVARARQASHSGSVATRAAAAAAARLATALTSRAARAVVATWGLLEDGERVAVVGVWDEAVRRGVPALAPALTAVVRRLDTLSSPASTWASQARSATTEATAEALASELAVLVREADSPTAARSARPPAPPDLMTGGDGQVRDATMRAAAVSLSSSAASAAGAGGAPVAAPALPPSIPAATTATPPESDPRGLLKRSATSFAWAATAQSLESASSQAPASGSEGLAKAVRVLLREEGGSTRRAALAVLGRDAVASATDPRASEALRAAGARIVQALVGQLRLGPPPGAHAGAEDSDSEPDAATASRPRDALRPRTARVSAALAVLRRLARFAADVVAPHWAALAAATAALGADAWRRGALEVGLNAQRTAAELAAHVAIADPQRALAPLAQLVANGVAPRVVAEDAAGAQGIAVVALKVLREVVTHDALSVAVSAEAIVQFVEAGPFIDAAAAALGSSDTETRKNATLLLADFCLRCGACALPAGGVECPRLDAALRRHVPERYLRLVHVYVARALRDGAAGAGGS